jgi:excisionase family DNA binding protein
MDQLLTVKEAAERLACTEAAIRKWLYQRRLPAVKVGRLVRLRETDLEAVIARGVRPHIGAPQVISGRSGG